MTQQLDGFEASVRPLLKLVQRLTGVETAYVTEIDWEAEQQEIVLTLNTSELTVPEGALVPWAESMCRRTFLRGKEHSSNVPHDYPGSIGAEQLGMQTYFAIPIIDPNNATVGTVCGASRRRVELDATAVENLKLIASAVAYQVTSHREGQMLRNRAERAETLSLIDPLTGLANRRGFGARLEEEAARAGRMGQPVAVLILDLDDFKSINDTYGHAGGDDVLLTAGRVLGSVARVEDVPARLGGDELALLLAPGDRASAHEIADRIGGEFSKAAAAIGMPCTVSVGVATTGETPLDMLMEAADQELYRQKSTKGMTRRLATQAPSGD